MKLLWITLLITACSLTKMQRNIADVPFLTLTKKIRPGEVKKMTFTNLPEFQNKKIYCKDRYIPSYVNKGKRIAFVAETYFSTFTPFTCTIGEKTIAHFTIEKKEFPSEKLNVPKKMVNPSKENRIRIQNEQNFLNKIYASSEKDPLFKNGFQRPLPSAVTSIYGAKRIFNNQKQTQHLGTDFKASIGTDIRTSNAGKVVVARNLYYTGNTVTVDHGLGIFSIYGHLSEIYVKEGDRVDQGIVLGKSGATGRVTGPHLHWGVKVNGHFIEGDTLILAHDNM